MSYDDRVVIERAENGYTVQMSDPAIVKANMKRDLLKYDDPKRGPYQNPQKEYVFADYTALETFLKTNLPKALPTPSASFSDTFSSIADEDDD